MGTNKHNLEKSVQSTLREIEENTTPKKSKGKGVHALLGDTQKTLLQFDSPTQKTEEDLMIALTVMLTTSQERHSTDSHRITLDNKTYSYTLDKDKIYTETIEKEVRLPLIKAVAYIREIERLQKGFFKEYEPTPPTNDVVAQLVAETINPANVMGHIDILYARLTRELNTLIELGVYGIRDRPIGPQIDNLNEWLRDGGKSEK